MTDDESENHTYEKPALGGHHYNIRYLGAGGEGGWKFCLAFFVLPEYRISQGHNEQAKPKGDGKLYFFTSGSAQDRLYISTMPWLNCFNT